MIDNEKDLKKALKIKDLNELKKKDNLKKFQELIKKKQITPSVAMKILAPIPDLAQSLTEVIKTMGELGSKLEDTKKMRWQFLIKVAKNHTLTGEQIIEATKIVKEIEKMEHIDWTAIFKKAMNVFGVIVLGVIITGGIVYATSGGDEK